jgi:hypothetical protein
MTEREQFEEWVKANWPDSVSLGMNIDGRYRYNHANALFGLWVQLKRSRENAKVMRIISLWCLAMTMCMSVAFFSFLVTR